MFEFFWQQNHMQAAENCGTKIQTYLSEEHCTIKPKIGSQQRL